MQRVDDPKVTVICLAYNHGQNIRDALDGFVMQETNFKFQVVIHDDASTDDTKSIILQYVDKYPNLFVPILQAENQYSKHIGIFMNFILPVAKGKYYAFCEGDDCWTDSHKLQKQYDFMENNVDYSMCGCSTEIITSSGEVRKDYIVEKDRDVHIEEIIREKNGRVFPTVSYFIKADVFKSIPSWLREFPVGDLRAMLWCSLNGKVRMLSDVMCIYRRETHGSWTERMKKDPDFNINYQTKEIEAYKILDEHTDYLYHNLINEKIDEDMFKIARQKRHLQEVIKTEFFKNSSIKIKIITIVNILFPHLF